MITEIVAPSPGESISEVEVGQWLVEDGDIVEKDQEIAEIESDKATLPIIAEQSGKGVIGYLKTCANNSILWIKPAVIS